MGKPARERGVWESDFLPRWAAGSRGAEHWLPVEGKEVSVQVLV